MREPVKENEFVIVAAELDRQAEELGPFMEARLDRARRQAVERGLTRRRLTLPLMGRMTLAGAGAALAVLLTVSLHKEPPAPPMAQKVEEFEIMTAQEQLDVIEDQEFFRWLQERESANPRGEV